MCEHLMLPSVFASLLCACVATGSVAVLNVLAHNRKQVTIQASHVVCRMRFYVSGFLQVLSFFNHLPSPPRYLYSHQIPQESGNPGLELSMIILSNIHSRHLYVKPFLFNYCLEGFLTVLKGLSNIAREWKEIFLCKEARQDVHGWP